MLHAAAILECPSSLSLQPIPVANLASSLPAILLAFLLVVQHSPSPPVFYLPQ